MLNIHRIATVSLLVLTMFGCNSEAPMSSDLQTDSATLAKNGDDKAKCGCGKVRSRLQSSITVDPPLLTGGGELTGSLKGTVYYTGNVADIVPIVSNSGDDGPVNPAAVGFGTFTVTNAKGVLTFRDVFAFEQTPNGIGTSYARVIDGTGHYEGASGYLFLTLMADETGMNFSEELNGRLYCKKHKD